MLISVPHQNIKKVVDCKNFVKYKGSTTFISVKRGETKEVSRTVIVIFYESQCHHLYSLKLVNRNI